MLGTHKLGIGIYAENLLLPRFTLLCCILATRTPCLLPSFTRLSDKGGGSGVVADLPKVFGRTLPPRTLMAKVKCTSILKSACYGDMYRAIPEGTADVPVLM